MSILVVGFFILGGFGTVALNNDFKNYAIEIIDYENTANPMLDSTHTILGEFFTMVDCEPSRYAHAALKIIYSGEYHPFYYVTHLYDVNKNAKQRCDELGVTASPTVVWDGGYRRDLGASSTQYAMDKYNTSLVKCGDRDVADIDLSLDVEWLGPGNPSPEDEGTYKLVALTPIDVDLSWMNCEMNIEVAVDNNEGSMYNGHLHVYVTEIESSIWDDMWGNPYTFAFLDYAFNDNISLSAGGTWEYSIEWDGKEHNDGYGVDFSKIIQDNIMIVVSVFDDDNDYVDETIGFVIGMDTDPKTYDVYFGGSNPPPIVSSNQSGLEYDPGILDFDTTYYWKIVVWDSQGGSISRPIWQFTTRGNDPPYAPSNPDPSGEFPVPIDVDLSWDGGDPDSDEVTYDVYFGPYIPPPLVSSNQNSTTYYPEELLDFNKTYYWNIVARDMFNYSTVGPIWSFTTEENLPPNTPNTPNPEDGKTNVCIDMILSWTGGDPNSGDMVTYNVYFGKSSPPPFVGDVTQNAFDPGIMDLDSTYYWQIVAEDSQGLSSTSPIWHFTTGSEKNKPPDKPIIKGKIIIHGPGPYDYKFKAVDPNGDDIRYFIDWDDGHCEWTDYYGSGEEVIINHTFEQIQTARIRARANDTYGALGPWGYLQWSKSSVKTITMPRSKAVSNSLLLRFLERYPLIQYILQRF